LNSKKQTGLLRLYKAEGTRDSSRLECCPAFEQTILGIETNRSAIIMTVKRYKKQLFDPEDEGTTILRNIGHYSPTPQRNITADYILQQHRCDSLQQRKTSLLDFFTQHGFHISPLTSFLGISIWWKTIQYSGYTKFYKTLAGKASRQMLLS
jgi:hypothetical protein